MKKFFSFVCVGLAMVAGLVSCKGDEPSQPQPQGKLTVTVLETTATGVKLNVKCTDASAYYMCMNLEASKAQGKTDDQIKTELEAQVQTIIAQYGTATMISKGLLVQGEKTLSASSLTPETDYCACVLIVDIQTGKVTEMAKVAFKTKAKETSNMTIAMKLDSITFSGNDTIYKVTFTPTKNDELYVVAFAAEAMFNQAGGKAAACMNAILNSYAQQGQLSAYLQNFCQSGAVQKGVKVTGAGVGKGAKIAAIAVPMSSDKTYLTGEGSYTLLSFSQNAPRRHNVTSVDYVELMQEVVAPMAIPAYAE